MLKARDAIVERWGEFPIVKPKPLPEDFGALGISDDDVKAIWKARQDALYASEEAGVADTTADATETRQGANAVQESLL